MKHSILLFLVFSLIVFGCGNPVQRSNSEELSIPESTEVKSRGIYHWKTTFDLSAADTAFIKRHEITRLYVRMFDVGMEINEANDSLEVVPLGIPSRLRWHPCCSASAVPWAMCIPASPS